MSSSSTSKFWNKVEKCKHKNISDSYVGSLQCETPYCEVEEIHCLDCGVYISKCGCGYLNGMSGWPATRWNRRYRKRRAG